MKMVIVTLRFLGMSGETSYDMEMPCQVPTKILISHICQTINLYSEGTVDLQPQGVGLWCHRLNRLLAPDETLESAGVWSGDRLDLK